MEILVKEVSNKKPNYLVYLMVGSTPVECYQENSLKNKNHRVIELYSKHFSCIGEITDNVREMSYNEFKNQLNVGV